MKESLKNYVFDFDRRRIACTNALTYSKHPYDSRIRSHATP